jgi:hypothetical protein
MSKFYRDKHRKNGLSLKERIEGHLSKRSFQKWTNSEMEDEVSNKGQNGVLEDIKQIPRHSLIKSTVLENPGPMVNLCKSRLYSEPYVRQLVLDVHTLSELAPLELTVDRRTN